MRVAIVHNPVDAHSAPDERDVLVQVQAVSEALESLGHSTVIVPCTLDLDGLKRRLESERPDCAFNLVESLADRGRLAHLAPGVFDVLGLPYTGSSATVLLLTNHKVLAKERMIACGLPTPAWVGPWPLEPQTRRWSPPGPGGKDGGWIVKSVWEHASFGIEEDGLIDARDSESVMEILRFRADTMGGACFAEAFVDGREFNLALLAGGDTPQVLPPAEILFQDYPCEKPRIVGYRAKWDPTAFEYHHTARHFDFPPQDGELLRRLDETARRCWELFGLGGYARVDFRVDPHGRHFILEVNANPCLSPDAGFAAALEQADIPYPQAIGRILADAFRLARHGGKDIFFRDPELDGRRAHSIR